MAGYLPGATFVDLGPDGGPYDEITRPKVCWHTTEGTSIAGAEAAFRSYPPHLCYDPRSRERRQYVRLDRHSYALRGGESDDEYVVQIELVGRAAETHGWPDEWYRNIGEDLVRPLRKTVGVPDQHLRFYRADEGIVLARPTSPIRLSSSAFRAFSGHLGHQHAPAPDEHWDPGGFRIDKALNYSQEDDMSWNDPLTFSKPDGSGTSTYNASAWLLWTNWYANMIPGLRAAIAAQSGQIAALTELVRQLANGEERDLEAIKAVAEEGTRKALAESTVHVDIDVTGPPQEGTPPA